MATRCDTRASTRQEDEESASNMSSETLNSGAANRPKDDYNIYLIASITRTFKTYGGGAVSAFEFVRSIQSA